MVKRLQKISPVRPEIFDETRQTTTWTSNAISIRLFSAETTGPIFTKILHDIVTLVALFNHAYTRHYPIPFLNARVTKVRSLPFFFTKSVAMTTSLEISKKRSRSIICTQKTLSFGEKIAKIGPVHQEILYKIRWTRREHATQYASVILFSAKTTRPIFTKILHNIAALMSLLNHAYGRR